MPNRFGVSVVSRGTAPRLRAAVGARMVVWMVLSAVTLVGGPRASADEPDLDAAVATTCTYPQVVAAMTAQAPEAAAKFNASPMAQSWLQRFLDASPAKRRKMAQKVQKMDSGPQQQDIGLVMQILDTCNNY